MAHMRKDVVTMPEKTETAGPHEKKPEDKKPESGENRPQTPWMAWAALIGIPTASTTAAQALKQNPLISLGVAAGTALGVVILGPFGKELKTRYDKRVTTLFD